jgi:hypothetical protein
MSSWTGRSLRFAGGRANLPKVGPETDWILTGHCAATARFETAQGRDHTLTQTSVANHQIEDGDGFQPTVVSKTSRLRLGQARCEEDQGFKLKQAGWTQFALVLYGKSDESSRRVLLNVGWRGLVLYQVLRGAFSSGPICTYLARNVPIKDRYLVSGVHQAMAKVKTNAPESENIPTPRLETI